MRRTPAHYDQLAKRHPRFPRALAQRIDRGDTLDDIAFWVRTQYGVVVSRETVRKWRLRHFDNNAA